MDTGWGMVGSMRLFSYFSIMGCRERIAEASMSRYDREAMAQFTLRTRTILLLGLVQVIILTLILIFFLRLAGQD